MGVVEDDEDRAVAREKGRDTLFPFPFWFCFCFPFPSDRDLVIVLEEKGVYDFLWPRE